MTPLHRPAPHARPFTRRAGRRLAGALAVALLGLGVLGSPAQGAPVVPPTEPVDADSAAAADSAEAAAAPVGQQSVLGMLVYWTAPDAVTPADLAQRTFVDSDAWQRESSYGTAGLTGAVVPTWLKIDGPPNGNDCEASYDTIFAQAKAAALAAGYDAADYDRTLTYFPGAACDENDSGAWAAGHDMALRGFTLVEMIVHELGHTNGLPHSMTLACAVDETPVVLAGNGQCRTDYEYSDGMGNGPAVSFNAVQKTRLGWLTGRTAALTPGTSVRLQPYETAGTTTAARLTTDVGRTYWFEYRQPMGIDSSLGAGLTGGVLVHLDEPSRLFEPMLLDLTPATYQDFTDAALTPGHPWTTPEGVTLTVSKADAGGVTVTAAAAPIAVGAPTAVAAAPDHARHTITVSWKPPTDGANLVTGYTVTRSGTDTAGRTATPVELGAEARSFAWTGLRPGVGYTFTVTAATAGKPGATATVTAALTNTPGTPRLSSAYSGSFDDKVVSVTANWKPATGGGPAASFTASAVDLATGRRTSVTTGPSTTSTKIPGLVTGHKYRVEVYGRNASGRGPSGTATNTVTAR